MFATQTIVSIVCGSHRASGEAAGDVGNVLGKMMGQERWGRSESRRRPGQDWKFEGHAELERRQPWERDSECQQS